LEGQLRAARAAQANEMAIAKDAIRNAAFGCEQVDRSDEALLSGNWKLRRTPGPAQPMGIPAKLSLKNNPMPGRITARWARVNNARVYQVQYTDPTTIPAPDWNTLSTETALSAKFTVENYPVGGFIAFRVRAVGTTGPGPWADILTARVM
jgi:hypothetical protein